MAGQVTVRGRPRPAQRAGPDDQQPGAGARLHRARLERRAA